MNQHSTRLLKTFCILALFAFAVLTAWSESGDSGSPGWPIASQNLNNTRSQPNEQQITVANVNSLKTKWVFTTGGDVSATPTVAANAVYFPDWSGNLYAVRAEDGNLIWSHKVSDYDNYPGAISRVSPAVHGDDLIIGDIESSSLVHNGANVIAVNSHTGALRWITRVDRHVAAIITGSPLGPWRCRVCRCFLE